MSIWDHNSFSQAARLGCPDPDDVDPFGRWLRRQCSRFSSCRCRGRQSTPRFVSWLPLTGQTSWSILQHNRQGKMSGRIVIAPHLWVHRNAARVGRPSLDESVPRQLLSFRLRNPEGHNAPPTLHFPMSQTHFSAFAAWPENRSPPKRISIPCLAVRRLYPVKS